MGDGQTKGRLECLQDQQEHSWKSDGTRSVRVLKATKAKRIQGRKNGWKKVGIGKVTFRGGGVSNLNEGFALLEMTESGAFHLGWGGRTLEVCNDDAMVDHLMIRTRWQRVGILNSGVSRNSCVVDHGGHDMFNGIRDPPG
jgi:hypothetical protein